MMHLVIMDKAYSIVITVCLLAICGTASPVSESRVKRVINGEETDHSESTWLVSLQAKIITSRFLGIPTSHKHVYCGGTLISDRWILTAAHCFEGGQDDVGSWHARFASKHIEMTGNERFKHIFGKLFNVLEWKQLEYHFEKIVMHPHYSTTGSWPNDIALVKLRETIPLSLVERVSLIDLDEGEDKIDTRVDCSVYGWGCAQLGSSVVSKINKADLPLISDAACYRSWRMKMANRVCAGGNGGKNGGAACQGDSGGPLICQTKSGNQIQTGIVSFIHSSSPTEYPVMFTKVSSYKNWIASVMRSN